MPGFTTHYIFGVLTFKKLENQYLKSIISRNLSAYKLGLQGPDIFFYYLPDIIKNPEYSLGKIMHETNTNTFFKNYFFEIDKYQEKSLEVAYAYISGFLCHYCLDTICHPYIYARTNYNLLIDKTKDKNRNIYSANHRSFETLIDCILLNKYTQKKPAQFTKDIIHLDKFTKNTITSLLSSSINQTYDNIEPLKPSFISRVINFVQIESRILANLSDNKKQYVEYFEKRFIKYNLLSSLIPTDDYEDTLDALNLSHNTWYSPWEMNISRSDSFFNLVQSAYKKCIILLNLIDSFLLSITNRKDITISISNKCTDISQLLNKIGNLSYHSGLLIN